MKKLAATICIVGTAFALSACTTGTTHHSGANHAEGRTAGNMEGVEAPVTYTRTERVFKAEQMK